MSADEQHTAAFWDSNAFYLKVVHQFTSLYSESAWKLAALPSGVKVLDIGAGSGALTLIAARDGAQVLSTDFSPGMVASVEAHHLPNVEAKVMDGQALDLPDGSFDAAFSMFGIMLFPDWQKGIAEMARVLRSGGLGCIGTWGAPTGAATNLLLAQRVNQLFPSIEIPCPVLGMNELMHADRFHAAMAAVGFVDIVIEQVSHDFVIDAELFADPALFFKYSPLSSILDEAQKTAVLDSIKASMEANGGTLPVPSLALIGIGRKA